MNTKMDIGQDPNPNRIQNEAQWGDSIFPELPAGARAEIKRLTPDDAKHFDEEIILKVMATYKGASTHENCMYILDNMDTPDIIDLENKYFEHGRTLISYHKSGGLTHYDFYWSLKMKRREREVFLDFPENKVYKPEFIKKHDATKLFRSTLQECVDELLDWLKQLQNPISMGSLFMVYTGGTSKKWNIKFITKYQKKSFNNFYDSEGYKYFMNGVKQESYGGCRVFVEGVDVQLSELGNFLVGFNGYLANLSLETIKILGEQYEKWHNHSESANFQKGKEVDKEVYYDELIDKPWYEVGYLYAKQEYPARNLIDHAGNFVGDLFGRKKYMDFRLKEYLKVGKIASQNNIKYINKLKSQGVKK